MDSDRYHLLQDRLRRLHMLHPRFDRPRPKTFGISALPNCNREVLMNRRFPVRSRMFVKENGSYCKRIATQHSRNEFSYLFASGEHPDLGYFEQVSHPVRRLLKHLPKSLQGFSTDHTTHMRDTCVRNLLSKAQASSVQTQSASASTRCRSPVR